MINYIVGDATKPKGEGKRLICHIVNDQGGWGKGFVLAVSKRWKEPEQTYRSAYALRRNGGTFYVGAVQIVAVEPDIAVANMVAQRGYSKPGFPALDYEALATCLKSVAFYCKIHPGSIHMPRIGIGLGFGDWRRIEKIIRSALVQFDVFVYDLPEKKS